jgi:hypothetical protein
MMINQRPVLNPIDEKLRLNPPEKPEKYQTRKFGNENRTDEDKKIQYPESPSSS